MYLNVINFRSFLKKNKINDNFFQFSIINLNILVHEICSVYIIFCTRKTYNIM